YCPRAAIVYSLFPRAAAKLLGRMAVLQSLNVYQARKKKPSPG
ncbi:MAG: hypothetical protein JWM91_776, partial [Rhodospirillales bacterium]|nr:hypothetical protein [Rhodospirillales bacterium]